MSRPNAPTTACALLLSVLPCLAAMSCTSQAADPSQLCPAWAAERGFVSKQEHQLALTRLEDGCAKSRNTPAAAAPDESKAFSLNIDAAQVTQAGGVVRVGVVPTDPWHVNLAFPTSMSWKANPGLQLNAGKFKKSEARVIDGGGLGFELSIKAAKPGTHKLEGRFKFAVCADGANCLPVRHDYAVDIEVPAAAP